MNKTASGEERYWFDSPLISYVIPLVTGLIFILLTLKAPATNERSQAVQLTIVIPEIIIWVIASVGAFRFKKYASSISSHPDGKGLNQTANALLLLVLYIILLTTASSLVNLFARSRYLDAAITLRNHLPVMTALASVIFLLKGSADLCKILGKDIWTRRRLLLLLGSSLAFLAAFGYAFYTADPNTITTNGIPRFVLPAQLLLITYVLPHVALWFMGLKACLNLRHYASNVPGSVYRALFKDLYRGIMLTFICIFAAQFLIISAITLSLPSLALALIYGILLVATGGFLMILKGARKLDRIETSSL